MRSIIFLFAFALIIVGCKPAQKTQTSQTGKYSEDLSHLRPTVSEQTENTTTSDNTKKEPKVFVEKPLFTVNKQLDAVLDSIDQINLTRKFIEGYTIQIYSGTKREDAMNAKKQLTTVIPQLESELQYVQPNFRVKTGKYFTLLEAEKDYEKVRQYFQTAIVVPDKIAIN
jgi:hypothetical protein